MRILIADDHNLVIDTISMFLEAEGDVTVETASSLDGAIDLVGRAAPFDMVVLDFQMPGMQGLDGLSRMLTTVPDVPVAVISGTASPQVAQEAIARGASGFLPKTLGAKSIMSAIRLMTAGEIFVPFDFMRQTDKKTVANLTERETQVLDGLCGGKSNKEIARDLELQEVTIKLHVKTLCRKLEAKNRTQAAMIAKERNLL
ncbi:response regulator transcription factor [Ponticoccus sp. SC2-23]|uniref:response regulator transcription factor n=1 Tax=Alexandriicola marinus TaxID=2081710 RepID=UPI000FD9DAAA|nr:response regulator transcription factor [Alexandriicola marinus]MBM1221944.1 response regulator transcription factor [Ponticoccus sp. SC6-9]MBM1226295.1 response regulator transcription factor [Ponticoccus sp. SC6-15]MBM1230891.1 response regulator transcription factor [Ponticoccus sp. SC6-38]MBM1235268.1 response regulator transcription factor [Ponticoccus sp. SC6-45]MBM1239913.1 response regulator transcription factor [Ponticoccus sp. SC6-49]MBM1244057.1 response regulator transcription 